MKALTRLGWILANTIGSDHDRIKLIRKSKKIKAKTSTNLQPDPIIRIELGLMFELNSSYIFSNLIDLKFN